jgi:hypothetical protein
MERAGVLEWMFAGGYPELHVRDLTPVQYHADYVVTYLERDVRSIVQVRNLRDFDRFLRLCATRTAQQLSYSSLAADVGVAPNTIKNWISVLQASGIIRMLEPYFENLGKRIVKTPKLYFLDTGLVCYLTGMRSTSDLEASPMLGAVFETHVFGQMIRHYANRGLGPQIYFYRDRSGNEVDFVIPVGGRFHLVECKWSETPSFRQRGFQQLRKQVGPDRILSESIVTPERGRRKIRGDVQISDSIDLRFLP